MIQTWILEQKYVIGMKKGKFDYEELITKVDLQEDEYYSNNGIKKAVWLQKYVKEAKDFIDGGDPQKTNDFNQKFNSFVLHHYPNDETLTNMSENLNKLVNMREISNPKGCMLM